MAIEIPTQIQNKNFRFLLLLKKEKIPFEKEWQKTNYEFDDAKVIEHLNRDGNYGIICGHGNLVVRDIDDEEFANKIIAENKIDTFAIKTGRGLHLYYIVDTLPQGVNYLKLNNGEIRIQNSFVVAPNSIHPSGKIYSILQNKEILKIPYKELEEKWITPYIQNTLTVEAKEMDLTPELQAKIKSDEVVTKYLNGDLQGRKSRSEAELSLVCKLVQLGLNKQQIFKVMADCKLGKWQEAPIQYRNSTFEKALIIITHEKKGQLQTSIIANYDVLGEADANLPKMQIYKGTELDMIEDSQESWLVNGLIPEAGFTIMSGKASSFKSTAAIMFGCAISAGVSLFTDLQTKKCKVLYVNEEQNWKQFKPQIKNIQESICGKMSEDIHFSTFSSIKIDTELGYKTLIKTVEENDIKVVFFDTLRRVVTFEENDANAVNIFYNNVVKSLLKKGISVICLHHSKKDSPGTHILDSMRGSSEFANIADSILYFRRIPGKDWFTIENPKIRGAREAQKRTIKVGIDSETNKYSFSDITRGEVEEGDIESNQCVNDIISHIKNKKIKTFKRKDIVDELKTSHHQKTVDRALSELQAQAVIQKIGLGFYSVVITNPVFRGAQSTLTINEIERINNAK